MVRAPALQCRATITFHYRDGQKVFDKAMEGRWSGSPEPNPLPIVDPSGRQSQIIVDFSRLILESRIEIYPGQDRTLDVAVRFDSDEECYGWNNEVYLLVKNLSNVSAS
jgi:hypothetical protein